MCFGDRFELYLEVLVSLGVLVTRIPCTRRPMPVDWSKSRRIQIVAVKRTGFRQRSRAGMSNTVDDKLRDLRGGTLSPSTQIRAETFGGVNFGFSRPVLRRAQLPSDNCT